MDKFVMACCIMTCIFVIGIYIHVSNIKKDLDQFKMYEYLFKTLDKHAWKLEHIYNYSLHTNIVIDAIDRRSMNECERLKSIHDRIIDDRKSTCENCIHGEVCSNQWLMRPDTEMKDICKNFEMKPKEK